MEPSQDEFKSHLSDLLAQEEQGDDAKESRPAEVAVLTKSGDDSAQTQNFRVELQLAHEEAARYLDLVLRIGFQVAILALDGGEEEAFEQSNDKLLLFRLIDLVLTEGAISGNDSLVNAPIEILRRHEVLSGALAEVAVEELESH